MRMRVSERKTVMQAETSAVYRGRALVVKIMPHEVIIRQKGRHRGYRLPWLAAIETAQKLEALETRLAKRSGRRP
jgi:hypothetical protein